MSIHMVDVKRPNGDLDWLLGALVLPTRRRYAEQPLMQLRGGCIGQHTASCHDLPSANREAACCPSVRVSSGRCLDPGRLPVMHPNQERILRARLYRLFREDFIQGRR